MQTAIRNSLSVATRGVALRIAAPRAVSPATMALAAVGAIFVSTYWLANRLTHGRTDVGAAVFEWERAIPFVEWTIVPYLSILAFFVLSFFLGQQRADYREALASHVARLFVVLLVSLLCFALMPLRFTFERPATSGLTGLMFEALHAFDLPYNRAPSLHISVLVILWARFASHLSGWLRVALMLWFALIGVSVLTTYQHHVIDVPAGFAAGWACVRMLPSSAVLSASALRSVFATALRDLPAIRTGFEAKRGCG